jgi:PTH1 family peptidyl-tRNA hydrolase
MVLDQLAGKLGVTFSRLESKALVTKAVVQRRRLILAKPQTYMNDSGQAAGILARYYKVPLNQILIAFDDVDLPFDTLRLRPGGGSGGQKGMKSIIEKLGTDEFARLRVGIGHPPGRMDAATYVLQDFTPPDAAILPQVLNRAVEAVLEFVLYGLAQAMNKYNSTGKTE